ncbi:MAG: orotidine-5'-phosphate decarboxylase [Corynebacterium sp.]|nr:orotidine-5'-phosphate decarboxylase [Corynebacterium sp.]
MPGRNGTYVPVFADRLAAASGVHSRLVVGVDPHPYLLEEWGMGLRGFARVCVEAFAGHVAMVKPQVAFFEQAGARGFAILEELIDGFRQAGTLVLADAKRGDIGSTMKAYAAAWLMPGSPLEVDALTVSPYLGVGALAPAFELAAEAGKGLFVLAATSNKQAVRLQTAVTGDGVQVAQGIVDTVAHANRQYFGSGMGSFGVVLGATVTNPPNVDAMHGPVLLPGVGAQGATAADVASIMSGQLEWGFPNMSRALLDAGPDVDDLRKAVISAGRDYGGV